MPIYDYHCANCGDLQDIWAKIDEMELICPGCAMSMTRLISPARIICDIEPYFDENLADVKTCPQGQWVKSRQHRKDIMKEQGLREIG